MNTTLLEDSNPAIGPQYVKIARLGRISAILTIATLLLIGGAHVWPGKADSGHKKQSEEASQTIAVARVVRENLSQYITLSAEFQPYQEVSVHAKVAGYVQSIDVDIGDHVKKGQLLAELEVPELRDDFKKASAELQESLEDVKRAAANSEESNVTYERLLEVAKANPKLVAKQDLDTARAKNEGIQSALGGARQRVEESEANKGKFRAMLDYASITAPFDGTITKRYADTGALVQAGTASSTQAMPLVDIAQDDVLRLVFPVPESAVAVIHVGLPVEIVAESLHQTFSGNISRFSGKVERSTRTMEAEVDVPNPEGKFTPGIYASVKLPVELEKNVIAVPRQALLLGDKATLIVLNTNNRIEERDVTVGLQMPSKVEIRSGLKEGELVLIGSRTGLRPGQTANGRIMEAPSME